MSSAVDLCRLDQFPGDALQKLLNNEHGERRRDGGNRQADEGVAPAQIVHKAVQRDDIGNHRQHHTGQDQNKNCILTREPEAGQLICRQRGDKQHPHDGHADIQQCLKNGGRQPGLFQCRPDIFDTRGQRVWEKGGDHAAVRGRESNADQLRERKKADDQPEQGNLAPSDVGFMVWLHPLSFLCSYGCGRRSGSA